MNDIASERSYKNRDEIVISPEKMGSAYEEKVKTFFNEHMHEDEEIRYVLDGQGFFDIRDGEDTWIRIRLEKDDLIILPAGIYHRFTTDNQNVRSKMSSTLIRLSMRQRLMDSVSISKQCGSLKMSPSGLLSIETLLSTVIRIGRNTFNPRMQNRKRRN